MSTLRRFCPLCETPERRPRANALEGRRLILGQRTSAAIVVAGTLLALTACSSGANHTTSANALHDNAITVGSFNFAESDLLAEIYSQTLERGGYHVRRAFDLGPREFVAPALARGLVELVPEYAGTALQFSSLGAQSATGNAHATANSLDRALEQHHVAAFAPAPAQDANAFVVTRATAVRENLRR